MEKVGDEGGADFLSRLMGRGGMDFDSERCYRWEQGFDTLDIVCIIYIFFSFLLLCRDVARLGPCDEGVSELVEMLGWTVCYAKGNSIFCIAHLDARYFCLSG